MEIMLFLLVFVLARVHITSQQETSSEDINNIMDKLLHQSNNHNRVKVNNEPPDYPEPYHPIPIGAEEGPAGNDSNIYYFKTYMAPRMKFKSNSETIHVLHRSNKTFHRHGGRKYEVLSEDELILGTSNNENIDNEAHRKKLRSGTNNYFSKKELNFLKQYGRKGDKTDKNVNILEDLFQKQISIKLTSEKSPYAHIPAQPLSLLHKYPEIVIDHISYSSDPKDEEIKITSTKLPQDLPHSTIKESLGILFEPTQKTTLPGESVTSYEPIENSKDSFPELQDIVASIIQNEDIPTTVVTETPEDESRKDFFDNILEKIPDKSLQANLPGLEPRALPLPGLDNLPAMTNNDMNMGGISLLPYLQNLKRNIISRGLATTYLHTPVLTQKWAACTPTRIIRVPLTVLIRPEPQRTRVVTAFRRMTPRYIYRPSMPVYYGLYQ